MMSSYRVVLFSLLTVASAACGGSTAVPVAADVRVRLFNDSHFTLTNVRVTVAPGVDVTESSLAPGALSPVHSVSAVYENPAVSVVADGKTLTAIPIEGFSGFNKLLGTGALVISINVADTPPVLRVTVTQPVEDQEFGTPEI
jgi:hypothetical protein